MLLNLSFSFSLSLYLSFSLFLFLSVSLFSLCLSLLSLSFSLLLSVSFIIKIAQTYRTIRMQNAFKSYREIGKRVFSEASPKPGGLDSRDQSRSRSRFLDLSRSTLETFRDYPYC
jgi:hypothetical protein